MKGSFHASAAALVAVSTFATGAAAQETPAAESQVLAEILVTASKREEKLQSVPASIVAVTADTMAKQQILQIKDFEQFAPSLNFQSGDEARLFNFSIRGVGSESFSVGVEPSVSTIVDGVVYTRPGAAFDGLGDLERVEVLNGPQGTLQGKNASAGAVVIITKRPNRDEFEAKVDYTIAEDNDHNASLMLTGPVSDTLAYRMYSYYKRADGQVINVSNGDTVNDVEGYGARGKLEFEPKEGVNLLLSADYTYRKSGCCGEPIRVPAASGNVTAGFTGAAIGPDSNEVNFNTLQEGHQENSGVSLEGNFEVGELTLTSLTAYRSYEDYAIRDRDGTNAPFTGVTAQQLFEATHPGIGQADATVLLDDLLVNSLSFACRDGVCGESNNLEMNDTFSQEFRLTSPGGGFFDYLLGLYYYDSAVERDVTIAGVRSNIAGNVSFPTPTSVVVNRATAYVLADMLTKVDTVNKAVFGNFNIRPADRLTLTAGFRYLRDELKWNHKKVTGPNGDHIGGGVGANPAGQAMAGANLGTPQFNAIREFSDDALIGKLSAKYEFTPDLLVYGSWARGYKGQAVDADIFLSQDGFNASPVAPEESRAWEGGFRSSFLERRVQFNVTYYDTVFSGYQTASTGVDGSGSPVLRSAGKLFTKGVETDVSVRPLEGLTLTAHAEFSDAEFGDLFVTATQNLKGGVPLNAPETKYGFTGAYDFGVGAWEATFAANYSHTSETLFTNLADATNPNSPWLRPAYDIANASISLTSPSEKYRAVLFVKNLFDEHYVSSLRRISGSVGGGGAVAQSIPRDFDRYFGMTLSVGF
ncbi:TonB-dependent receptor [Steroidobacter agaridevorans]|uniref:TonB-dependent receptor n=1 Tax=Steroidobacter agaridevorans TaxID=2695856 RepID=UPI00132736EB|nr:TonB-dependent receptor [Steroidobacter agaridevorans]GFE90046.1 TonB-dependent receptor [Steroidobacter agaridevorans]